jgi:hypothetical protein
MLLPLIYEKKKITRNQMIYPIYIVFLRELSVVLAFVDFL